MSDKELPQVLTSEWLHRSPIFRVQRRQLQFSNGEQRTYERLNPDFHRAVMVVPLLNDDSLLMVREYGAGMHQYYWSFPKGAIDGEESPAQAANRELQEEAGYAADDLQPLLRLALSPSYMGNQMHILLAQDLYPQRLAGDEPEPLEVGIFSWAQVVAMISAGEVYEAYAVAAFYRAQAMCRGAL